MNRINGGVRCFFFFVYIYWVFALQVFDQWKAIFTNFPRVRSIIGCGNDLYTDGGEETIFREYAHGLDLRMGDEYL